MVEMERTIETTGTDVDAAVAAGLANLNVERDAVEIEVLDEGSRGVLGIGAREARVRLTLKPVAGAPVEKGAPDPAAPLHPAVEPAQPENTEAQVGRGILEDLLPQMGIKGARIGIRQAEPAAGEGEPPWILEVSGPGTDALIGRRGKTLAALQHITRLMVGQETASRANLIIDVEGFKARREKTLRGLAVRMAEQAMRTNRKVVLEPMPPHERRIIHLALRDHPRVTTESIGEGKRRKVTIIPQYQ